MWRTVSLLILGFWLVMSSLLVRYVWFPEGTQFAEVPPRMVLRQFLEQGSAVSNAGTLDIYHRDQKLGHATMSCRRVRESQSDYLIRLDGVLEKGTVNHVAGTIRWGMSLRLLDVENFGELKGNIRLEEERRVIEFSWQRGARLPTISLRGGADADVNAPVMQAMIEQILGTGGASAMTEGLGVAPGTDIASLVQVKARDSVMDFAGHKSKGYLLEFTAMDHWKARAFITEAGELALVDLPEGYRLVEPDIHGLTPDYDAEDEEEVKSGNGKAES